MFFASAFLDEIVKDAFMDEHFKLIGSIMPSIAIQRCFYCIAEFERQRRGLTLATVTTSVLNFRVEYGLIMMVTFFVLSTALGIYFTRVLPGIAGGFREHWLFCLGV